MSKTKKGLAAKFTASFLSLSTAIMLSGVAMAIPQVASAITIAELQAQIADLQKQLDALQSPSSAAKCSFTRDLTVGSRGADVKCLQDYLTSTGHFSFSGGSTSYFGSITKGAVSAWQAANGVSPTAGYFGSISRGKYNSVVAGAPSAPGAPPAPTVPGTGLAVAAGTHPAASLAPENAARVPFTVVRLTASNDGDITVSGFTVERTGLAADSGFAGVVLLDENGVQLGIAKTLNSNHQAVVGDPVTVKAGQSRTLTIAGNMDSDLDAEAGQVAFLSVISVNTSATVSGSLPITGAGHTINGTLAIGSVTMQRGSLDPGTSVTKEVGTTAYTFSSVRVTAGSAEKVYLESMRWNQTGSVGSGDLKNVKTYVDGTAYDTTLSSDGKYYTATFPGKGLLIDKGFSKEASIKGDIDGGSGRTVDFDLAKRTDLGIKGENFGYGIIPPQTGSSDPTDDTAAFSSVEDPWYDAAQVTVSAGTINVSVATTIPSQNIAVNLQNQPLGGFVADVKGEAITVASTRFNIGLSNKSSTADVDDITSVTLVDENGAVVAGPVDAVTTGGGRVTFTDTVTFPAGMHTYTLKGKIGTDIANNSTIQASSTPSSNFSTVKGLVTGNTITPSPTSAISLSQMTVKTGSFVVTASAVPIAQTVIAGASQFEFARYILDVTASGEDVRVTSLPLAYGNDGGAASDVTNCKLRDGTGVNALAITTGSNIVNPTAIGSSTNFTFDGTGIIIAKGTSKTLALRCDLRSGATGGYYWGLDSAATYTGSSGVTSGQEITEVFNESNGQKMTSATAGTLAAELDASSAPYTIVSGGQLGVELGRIKFRATNEDIDLKQVALQLSQIASNTPDDLIGRQVTLWTTTGVQVGTAVFPTGDFATSSQILAGDFRVPKDGEKILVVKGDIAAVSNSGPLTVSGDLLRVDYDGGNLGLNGNYGTGASSGSTINGGSADTAAEGVRVMRGYPTFTRVDLGSTVLVNGIQGIARWSVKANGNDVSIKKLTLRIATTSVVAADLNIFGFTDTAFSTPVPGVNTGGQLSSADVSLVTGWASSATDLEVNVNTLGTTNILIVPAGATRYFEARVNMTGVDAAGDSISTALQGDAAFPVPPVAAGQDVNRNTFSVDRVEADTNDDFIWSPNSTTTATSTSVDWSNGFGAVGLPSTNMTSQVLSK